MKPLKQQAGYFLLMAVFLIIVMGVMGNLIAYLFASRGMVGVANFRGARTFYLAESGLEIANRVLTRSSLNTAPTRLACSAITGTASLTNASLLNGSFTATAAAPSVATTALSAALTASANSLTVSNAAGLEPAGRVLIDAEAINYGGISGNTLLGLTRGAVGTQASSHVTGTPVGQYQCTVDVVAGEPSAVSPSTQREINNGIQLQDGVVVGARQSNNYSLFRWNGGTELNWTNISLSAGGNNARGNINHVSLLSYADGWAVGDMATNGFIFLRWNGSTWTANLLAGACSGQNLLGVSMVSANEGWAVGARYRPACANNGNYRYTLLRWNGSAWSLQVPTTIPADTSTNPNLNSVAVIDSNGNGSGDFGVAVGDSGRILHYNGSTWVVVSSPTTQNLLGVTVISATDAWAVGAAGVILHWNGSSWSLMSSPTSTQLNDLSMIDPGKTGHATFGMAVGNSGVILTYNGSTWSGVTSGSTNLLDIAVATASDAWAAGASGLLKHWDGSTWQNTTTNPAPQWNSIALIAPKVNPESGWQPVFH